jgi:hypothetical protein
MWTSGARSNSSTLGGTRQRRSGVLQFIEVEEI